jgi:tRNA-dihydrouridine synthase B
MTDAYVASSHVFTRLGLPKFPVILAPLAGVSDHPFRRLCQRYGADLTYVEMISATALLHHSARTLHMLKRHPSEPILGVQLTGRTAEEVGQATAFLNQLNFETIDLNMGCPVQKVVKSGCGSAILKDPQRVYDTVKKAVENSSVPVSAKIRLGWDHTCKNAIENAQAIEAAGAKWVTVHGRTRSDDYSAPVDLEFIAEIKRSVGIPVIGNGNIFRRDDALLMKERAQVDGLMVSRGALGNPWLFSELKNLHNLHDNESKPILALALSEWLSGVCDHIQWHLEEYGATGLGAITMRKHLLWYMKGWPSGKTIKEILNKIDDLTLAMDEIKAYAQTLETSHPHACRVLHEGIPTNDRFLWDPKYEMDRKLDRGVGDDGLESLS